MVYGRRCGISHEVPRVDEQGGLESIRCELMQVVCVGPVEFEPFKFESLKL